MAKASPLTPSVLRWAVEQDGRSVAAIAEAASVPIASFEAWVVGDDQPTVGQVSDLARVLARPRALFFLPSAPEAATLPSTFRHLVGSSRQLSAEVRRQVRRVRRVQQALSWVLQDDNPPMVPTATLDTAPEEAAQLVRRWLDVSTREQTSWSDDRQALRAWRQALDDRGVFVFVVPLERGDVRGFASWDDQAPCIVLNLTGVSPAARIFTLLHELGHLVLRQDSACMEVDDLGVLVGLDVERWCEAFAAAVLMPRDDLLFWLTATKQVRPVGLETVRRVMRRYRVSGRAAAVRLIELGAARRPLYQEVVQTFVPKPPDEKDQPRSPQRWEARLRSYGPRALTTVLHGLPERDALNVLYMQAGDLRQLPDGVVDGP